MNIKEVEAKSGISCATIRRYEKKGLLVVERRQDGCREYSKENFEELRRIRLFREMGVSVEKIKELQNAPNTLAHQLQQHIVYMYQQMYHMKNAIAVCEEMQRAGLSYHTVDAEQYLEKLHCLKKDSGSTVPYVDVEKETPHPYIRYIARSVDFVVFYLIYVFVRCGLFRKLIGPGTLEEVIGTVLVMLLVLVLEPLCISLFRTTPGKCVFGITLSKIDGTRLTYKEAFCRTYKVLFWGLGWNIPFFGLYREWKSYRQDVGGEGTAWDSPEVEYRIAERHRIVPVLQTIFCVVLFYFLAFEIAICQMTPPNKGDLTLEEYVENYNYYVDYCTVKRSNKVYTYEGCYLEKNGQFGFETNDKYEFIELPVITYDYTFDGENLTGVSFRFEKSFEGPVFFNGLYEEMVYSTLALAAAQEEYHLFNFKIIELFYFLNWKNLAFQDYEATFAGVDISCDVNYEEAIFNLHATGSFYGMVEEGAESWYDIEFNVTK